MATFKATLDEVTYLGAESVDKVEFLWWREGEDENGEGTGEFTLEPGRPSCTDVQGGGGKTEFECETDFLDEHRGTQTFYAFTHAELFGVPLPVPLEVAANAVDSVDVGGCIGYPNVPASFYIANDTAASGRGTEYTSSADPVEYGDVGATIRSTSEEDETDMPVFSLTVRAQDFLCVQADDTTAVGDSVYVRIHVAGQLSVEPPSNVGGLSNAYAELEALAMDAGPSLMRRSWAAISRQTEEPLPIDEEIVVAMRPGYWCYLIGNVRVYAGSHYGYSHEASARLTYTIMGIEDSSGNELQGVSLKTRSGSDYGFGGG